MIPWSPHIQIFTKTTSIGEALFYVQETATHNWSRAVLVHHIESRLFLRKGKSYNNFQLTLPKPQSDLANELLKNPYNLDFLSLSEEATERDLENAILANIKKFLLELGSGFSFIGQQYHLKVGEKDYYLDLLFYHTRLHCYFIIELKVIEFKPEHAGQLEFYITSIDELKKMPEDNPTIGLLLCRSIDKVTVEYTLKSKKKSMGISEYRHSLPADLKNELPDIETIKHELQKEIVLPKKPFDEKMKRLKELVQKMNNKEADIEKDTEIIKKIFYEIERPLIELVEEKFAEVKPMFNKIKVDFRYNGKSGSAYMTSVDLEALISTEGDIWMLGFEFSFEIFKKAGTKAFSVWHKFEIQLDRYKYRIGPDRTKIWDERVYGNLHNRAELEKFAERFADEIIDDITQKTEDLFG